MSIDCEVGDVKLIAAAELNSQRPLASPGNAKKAARLPDLTRVRKLDCL